MGAATPNVQTLGVLTAENKTFYDRTLLSRLLPNLVFYQYGQKRPLPKNEGKTINFRRYGSLAPATTALTEGVTPAGESLAVSAITATLEQYGSYVTISDVLDLVGIDKNITEASALLGEQGGITIDTVTRDEVAAGTNVLYAGEATARDAVGEKINGMLIQKAVRNLRRQNVRPLDDGYYLCFIHPDIAYDLMTEAGSLWQDVSKYNGGEDIRKGEIGKLHGARFIETTQAPVFSGEGGSSADVYATILIGKEAYGVVDIESKSAGKPQIIVKPAGSAGTEDPLEQRSTVGWKALFAAKRLQELAIVRIESIATA